MKGISLITMLLSPALALAQPDASITIVVEPAYTGAVIAITFVSMIGISGWIIHFLRNVTD